VWTSRRLASLYAALVSGHDEARGKHTVAKPVAKTDSTPLRNATTRSQQSLPMRTGGPHQNRFHACSSGLSIDDNRQTTVLFATRIRPASLEIAALVNFVAGG
jgi:hypothetical protein